MNPGMNRPRHNMLGRFLLPLLLTLAIEGFVAYLCGLRTRQEVLAVAMINVITQPAFNYLLLVLGYLGINVTLGLVSVLEIPIVFAEWLLLTYVFGASKRRFFVVSFLANTASFLAGIVLFWK